MNIPTPHLDELKRLSKATEDYAAEHAAELDAEVAAIKEAKMLAQQKAQQTECDIRAVPDIQP